MNRTGKLVPGRATIGVICLAVILALYIPTAAAAAGPHAWSPAATLSVAGQNATAAQIAVDSAGVFTAVWQRSNGSHTIIQASRSVDGATWSTPIDLSLAGANAANPQIVVDPDGNVIAVWARVIDGVSTIIQTSRSADGVAWSAPVDVSLAGAKAADPQVAVSSDGSLTAVWKRGTTAVVQASHSADGTTWSTPEDLSTAGQAAQTPQIVVSPDGSVTVVWHRSDGATLRIQARHSTDGTTWSSPAVDLSAAGGNAQGEQLAVASDGALIAIWSRDDGSDYRIQTRRSTDGTTWDAAVNLSVAGQDASAPQIIVDAADTFTASWYRSDGSNNLVQLSNSADGTSWSAPVTLSATGGTASEAHLAVASDGGVTAVWRRYDSGSFKWIAQASNSDDGVTWNSVVDLSAAGQNASVPRVAAAPGGTVAAVWDRYDGTNNVIQSAFTMTPPVMTSGTLPAATVGEAYSFQLTATGNPLPSYAVTSGILPAGLSVTTAGLISGTPTSTDAASFTITASNGASPNSSQAHSLTPLPPLVAPTITSATPAAPTVGEAYSFQLTATGNPAPTYAVTAGSLPAGLGLSSAGLFSGTSTSAAVATFTVTASNGESPDDSASYVLTPLVSPAITSAVLPAPTVGEAYSFQLTATGNPAPTFTVTTGSLPAGLSLSTAGLLAGTPTSTSSATFTVTADNGVGASDTESYTLTPRVSPAAAGDPKSLSTTGVNPASIIAIALGLLVLGLVLCLSRFWWMRGHSRWQRLAAL